MDISQYVTSGGILSAIFLIVAVAYIVGTVLNAMLLVKQVRASKAEPVQAMQAEISELKGRVAKLERHTGEHEQEMQLVLKSLMALLSHEINGNSTDKLQESMHEINAYLISK